MIPARPTYRSRLLCPQRTSDNQGPGGTCGAGGRPSAGLGVRPGQPFGELDCTLAEQAGRWSWARSSSRRQKPEAGTFMASGKLEEVRGLCEELGASVVIFDHDLSPRQIASIEEIVGRKIIDRSELILDIFASRATTHEGETGGRTGAVTVHLPTSASDVGPPGAHHGARADRRHRDAARRAAASRSTGDWRGAASVARARAERDPRARSGGWCRSAARPLHCRHRRLRQRREEHAVQRADRSPSGAAPTPTTACSRRSLHARASGISGPLPGRGREVMLSDTVGFVRPAAPP